MKNRKRIFDNSKRKAKRRFIIREAEFKGKIATGPMKMKSCQYCRNREINTRLYEIGKSKKLRIIELASWLQLQQRECTEVKNKYNFTWNQKTPVNYDKKEIKYGERDAKGTKRK